MQYKDSLDQIAVLMMEQIDESIANGEEMSTVDFREFINNDPLIQYIKESSLAVDLAGAIRRNEKLIEKIIKNNKMITPSKPA